MFCFLTSSESAIFPTGGILQIMQYCVVSLIISVDFNQLLFKFGYIDQFTVVEVKCRRTTKDQYLTKTSFNSGFDEHVLVSAHVLQCVDKASGTYNVTCAAVGWFAYPASKPSISWLLLLVGSVNDPVI